MHLSHSLDKPTLFSGPIITPDDIPPSTQRCDDSVNKHLIKQIPCQSYIKAMLNLLFPPTARICSVQSIFNSLSDDLISNQFAINFKFDLQLNCPYDLGLNRPQSSERISTLRWRNDE